MFRMSIGRVRLSGLIEGTSFLILLIIAMPLKYAADLPEVVSIVGMLLAVGAAFIPFGPFLLDKKLRAHSTER